MRPINLIPTDERRGGGGSSLRELNGWALVGGLALTVLGAVMLVTTSNALSEREHELERLEHEQKVAEKRAAELSPYIAFRQTAEARKMTVATLAASRFDWERVLRELSLIIPDDITILTLTGTVASGVNVPGGTSGELRGEIPGPALEMTGCGTGPTGRSQEAVARFIAALYEIDGVTRVGMSQADVEGSSDEAGGGGPTGAGACAPGQQVSNFELVAAFDGAPVPGEGVPALPVPAPETGPGAGAESVPASGAELDIDETAQTSARQADDDADSATETYLPGG